MEVARQKFGAVVLDDGTVLFVGGADINDFQGKIASAEIYDPQSGTSRVIGSMAIPRFKIPNPVNLPGSDRVLIAGGADTLEIYDESTMSFSTLGETTGAESYPTATLLDNGDVVISGGYDEAITSTKNAWLFIDRAEDEAQNAGYGSLE